MDILYEMGVADYVTGETPCPAADKKDEVAAWKKDDRKALTAIRLRVASSMFNYVMSAETSKAAMDSLENIFRIKGPIATVLLRRKLYRYIIDETDDIEEHLRTLRGFQEQLALLGHKVSDEDFAFIILTALPDSWDSFISSIDFSSSGTLKSMEIIARIQSEASRRKDRAGTTALFAKSKSAHGKGNAKFRKGVVCWNCGKEGHLGPNCKQPETEEYKEKMRNFKKKKDASTVSKTNVVEVSQDNSDVYEFTVTIPETLTVMERGLWLADTGAQQHIVNDRSLFTTYSPTPGHRIKGTGELPAHGRGRVEIAFAYSGVQHKIVLPEALYVPDLAYNLISIGRLRKAGYQFWIGDNGLEVIEKGSQSIVGCGTEFSYLYRMDVVVPKTDSLALAVQSCRGRSWFEWHCALGHLNKGQLKDLPKLVDGMIVDTSSSLDFDCDACVQARQTKTPFPKMSLTTYLVGEAVAVDTWGPASVASLKGNRYFLGLTDFGGRWSMTLGMKTRDQALGHFKTYKALVERQRGIVLKIIRVDNAKELVQGQFKAYLDQSGIKIETTSPYSSAQNGIAERLNRTIVEHGRAMLITSKLPKTLWEEAIMYACYLKNRSPTRALKDMTPHEAFWGKRPDLATLHEFGVECWVLLPEGQQDKLSPKSILHRFVGISEESRAWRVYNPSTHRVITSRNVIFRDRKEVIDLPVPAPTTSATAPSSQLEGESDPSDKSVTTSTPPEPVTISPDPSQPRRSARNAEKSRPDYKLIANPDARKPALPSTNSNSTNAVFVFLNEEGQLTDEPRTLAEVMARPDWPLWKAAMDAEIAQLKKLGTYKLVDLPEGRKAIGCRWVFLIKRDNDGSTLR